MQLNRFKWVIAASLIPVAIAGATDLTAKYPGKVEHSPEPIGRDWTCEPGDVWKLKSFKFGLKDALAVETGPATLVIGKAAGEADSGPAIVWAVVLPDEPGRVTGETAAKAGAEKERVQSIWVRFNPRRLGELFPAESVLGPGAAEKAIWGKRVANWKMIGSWQANNLPVIPSANSIVVDLDTTARKRRFFSIDTDKNTAEYVAPFADRALPIPRSISADEARQAFEEVWAAFDTDYAMFAIKPKVDWPALRDKLRPQAEMAKTNYELAVVLAELIAPLEDLHAWVKAGPEWVPVFARDRPLNGNFQAIQKAIPGLQDTKRDLAWGRTSDGIGYINIYNLGNQELPAAFDQALEQLADTWGMVVDLRFNGGGDELLGRQAAGRFLDQPRVYSLNQYRNGPAHGDLGPKLERKCEPRGPWRYAAPLVVLTGQKTMSSAESFALMLAQAPQATTMGDRTAGSSGNPRQVTLVNDVVVNLPRWLDMDPSGKPIDGVGIAPKVPVPSKPADFSATSDPVLNAALARLRQLPAEERKPGRTN